MLIKRFERGNLIVVNDVVKLIVQMAIAEIEGVKFSKESFKEKLQEVVKRKGDYPNIEITSDEQEEISVNVTVAITYGSKLIELCKMVQKNVKSHIELFTEFKVKEVNVIVNQMLIES